MRRPWFPFYVDDWRHSGKVQRMSNAERGCYVELMCYQWDEGFVPDDLTEVAHICGEPLPSMRKMWKRLEPCFPRCEDGHRRNPRVAAEREKAERISYQNTTNVGKRYAGRSPTGSGSVASPVTTTQVTDHTPQEPTTSVLRTGLAPAVDNLQPKKDGVMPSEPNVSTRDSLRDSLHAVSVFPEGRDSVTNAQSPWDSREAAKAIRELCYRPDGKEPEDWDIGRDLAWWRDMEAAGQTPARIIAALHGLPQLMPRAGKWRPAKVFSKQGDWVSLFERAVTEDGKHHRPQALGAVMQQLATPPLRKVGA